jgi:putative phage-type endonuclease
VSDWAVRDRADWLRWRREGIGSSDAAAIAGLDPWRGPMSVYLDKVGELDLDDQDGKHEYQRWGQLLEPAMVDEFQNRTDLYVTRRQAALVHPEHAWMRATVDGIVVETRTVEAFKRGVDVDADPEHQPLGLYEAKTSAEFKSGDWKQGVPENYRLQVQHQLGVTGLDHAWVAVLHGGNRFMIYELEREQRVIDLLVRIEGTFWRENVLARRPPDVDGRESSTDAIREAFRRVEVGKVLELGPQGATLLDNLRFAKEAVAAAERQEHQAQQALMLALGDAEAGSIEGRLAVTWKQHKRTSIDVETLRNQEPDVARRFEQTTSYRQLRLQKENSDG